MLPRKINKKKEILWRAPRSKKEYEPFDHLVYELTKITWVEKEIVVKNSAHYYCFVVAGRRRDNSMRHNSVTMHVVLTD